ncbi:hypothetical protein C2S52_004764 [Perilla frutescens var. hirtella]|nr:hypothetical protein C2S51_010846 [Perilla frutescens var. frutescens]KAH6794287.1 hypothetical protein C2S52_004764 [Perilla frutescens var. hirtella]
MSSKNQNKPPLGPSHKAKGGRSKWQEERRKRNLLKGRNCLPCLHCSKSCEIALELRSVYCCYVPEY